MSSHSNSCYLKTPPFHYKSPIIYQVYILTIFFRCSFPAASETRSGYFEFDVTDGFKTIYRIRFTVEIHELVLAVTVSETLQVFPGLLQPITGNSLRTTTNENNANTSSRPIVYTLQTKPTNGQLVTYNVDDAIQEVTSFTQEDIDSGSIYYKHWSTMVGFTQEDYFVYDVTTAYSEPIKFKRFNVCISLENINFDNRNQVLTLGNVSVVEGGRIEINRSHLDVSKLKRKLSDFVNRNNEVNIVLIRGPEHGILQINENNLTTEALITGGGYQLTQREINRGQLVYRHDHSDEPTDSFTFILEIDALRDRPSPEDALTGCSIRRSPSIITVNIQVRPVNDQPFQLEKESPGIVVTQGFNESIGPTILMTVDADTGPEELRYNITSSPSHGHLVSRDNPRLAINTFTQYDVNQEKIVYIHDGSRHTSDAFQFAVSDGRHKPIFKTFTIRVILLKLELVSLRNAEILQGEYSAVLTWDNLNITSNGADDRIRFNITKPALYGEVFVGETASNQFTKEDLLDGNVVYIQTDISSATDIIEIVIYDTYNVIYNKKLKIEVKPRLTLSKKPVQVNHKSGESIRLTLNDTDASDLATLTNSTPVYKVVQEPSRGKLFLMTPVNGDGKSKRETKRRKGGTKSEKKRKNEKEEESIDASYVEKSAFEFTHDDIVKELVAYQPNPTGSRLIQKDNFTFLLTAHNAQSVRARLDIEIIPAIIYSSDDVRSTTLPIGWTSPATKMAPAPVEGSKVEETSGKLGNDKLYIVFLVAGISVLCVLALIVFKCVRRKRKKKVETLANFELNNTKNTTLDSPTTDPVRPDLGQIAPGGGGDVVVPANNETNSILSQNSNSSMTGRLHRQDAFSEEAPFPAPTSGAVPGDGPRAGYVRIVPDKPEEEQSGANTPAGTIKKEHVIFDWESVDPELLEHCRKTNPVLHKNQYWV